MKKIKVKFVFNTHTEEIELEVDGDDTQDTIASIVEEEWQAWVWEQIGNDGYWEIIDD